MSNFKSHFVTLAMPFIRQWEGERLTAYQCSAGVWTIGVGHTKGVEAGDVITQEESERLFRDDLEGFKSEMAKLIRVDVSKTQFIALMSFVFNLGIDHFMTSKLLKYLNAGDYKSAAYEFPKWKFAGGVAVQGLLNRRLAEKALFEK